MSTGDGDRCSPFHQLAKHGGPGRQLDPPSPGLHQLGIVVPHRGGVDDARRTGEVLRPVTDVDARTEPPQLIQHRSLFHVRAGHRHPSRHEEARDAAHSGPADADQVYRPLGGGGVPRLGG